MLYPSSDFKCPHEHACPHLEFLSTKYVLNEYSRAEEDYQEHLNIIDRFDDALKLRDERIRLLERENNELKAKLKMLHRRQFKPNKKSSDASGAKQSIENQPQEKKRRGAPVGHPGWQRPKPKYVDRTVHVPAPTQCPYCQKFNLKLSDQLREHIQEDIVLKPQPVVTRYVHEQAFCPTCNRLVAQAAEDEILNAPIGPVAKSVAIYLRYRIGISYRKATQLLEELFGLRFVAASAVGFDRKASSCGEAIYDDIKEKIRVSAVVHADETSWRNDGKGYYAWFAGNRRLAFFYIDPSRSAAVAKSIFGDAFDGILVRDRYAAYNSIADKWQSCLSHIITKAEEIRREHQLLPQTQQEQATDKFCDQTIALFKDACGKARLLTTKQLHWDNARRIEKKLVGRLSIICKMPLGFKPAETLRAYLVSDEQKYLFTFLRHRDVPPTNNHAEQSIRHIVIFRKTSFGTRSEIGPRVHSILLSLVQTARRQGVDPRQFLQTLLTTSTTSAQAALYNNSS